MFFVKKLPKIFLFIVFIALFMTSHAGKTCNKLIVSSGTYDWFPVSYKVDGVPTGIAFDVVKNLANKIGIRLKIEELSWKRALQNLEIGYLDIMIALYWNKERNEKYIYTKPYFSNEIRVFVKKGREFELKRLADLIGKRGVVPDGGSFGEKFDAFAKKSRLNLYGVKDKSQSINMVLLGRADYFILDYFDALSYLVKNDLMHQFTALPFKINVVDIYMAMSKKSNCKGLLDQINQELIQMKSSGEIDKIIDRYIKLNP